MQRRPRRTARRRKADKDDVHRYLFVMARFNKDAVKQPELVKLPELPAKSEAKPADQPAAKQRQRRQRRRVPPPISERRRGNTARNSAGNSAGSAGRTREG